MKRKLPVSWFVSCIILNCFLRFWWLLIPSVVLLIVGIFFPPCLYVGLALFLLDIMASLIEQIVLSRVFGEESDYVENEKFKDEIFSDDNWRENTMNFVERKISDQQNEIDDIDDINDINDSDAADENDNVKDDK